MEHSCEYLSISQQQKHTNIVRYVAMHTMQENSHSHNTADGSAGNGYADPYAPKAHEVEGMTMTELIATVGGMLLPLVLQAGHAH